MPPTAIFDAQRRRIPLGPELGRGGEGAVYEVPSSATATAVVAKLYKVPPVPDKARKLAAMAAGASPALLQVAAWPVGTLHDASGRTVGLTMERITASREIHHLYGPSHRRADFPGADWRFLTRAARNLAAAIGTVHRTGAVIGDINQGNALVDATARIKLIDCDSFQIRGTHGGMHLCEVGIGHFTPPELQGKSFQNPRSAQHDAFGLAVLIFHLLFMGRHPFAGQYHGPGDMPIERAIKEHRFAFGAEARTRLMSRPPHSLALIETSPALAACFERAFAPAASTGHVARPTAAEWVAALEAFEQSLRPCTATPAHHVPSGTQRCSWCAIEAHGGPAFFRSVAWARSGPAGLATAMPAGFDYARLVQQVRGTTWSSMALTTPAAPVPTAALPAVAVKGARRAKAAWVAGIGAIGGVAIGILPVPALVFGGGLLVVAAGAEGASGIRRLQRERRAALGTTGGEAAMAERAYETFDREVGVRVLQLRQEFDAAAQRYQQSATEEQAALARLASTQEAQQRQDFLDRFHIDQADIPGIGAGLKATLASYGIETAADVGKLQRQKVPGIGASRATDLRLWRDRIAQGFRFNRTQGANPASVQAVRDKAARERRTAAATMMSLSSDLERRLQGAHGRRRELVTAHGEAARRFAALRGEVAALDTELRVADALTARRGSASRIAAAVVGAFLLIRLAAQSGPSVRSDVAGDLGPATASAPTPTPPPRTGVGPLVPAAVPDARAAAVLAAELARDERARADSMRLATEQAGERAALAVRCDPAGVVCLFSVGTTPGSPVVHPAPLALAGAPAPARNGWFRVTLLDGTTGLVRSADMPRVTYTTPLQEPDYVP